MATRLSAFEVSMSGWQHLTVDLNTARYIFSTAAGMGPPRGYGSIPLLYHLWWMHVTP